jgi:hypothetical protein
MCSFSRRVKNAGQDTSRRGTRTKRPERDAKESAGNAKSAFTQRRSLPADTDWKSMLLCVLPTTLQTVGASVTTV